MITARLPPLPTFSPIEADFFTAAPAKHAPVSPARDVNVELFGSIIEGAYLPRNDDERTELKALIAQAVAIGKSERFMRVAGLRPDSKAMALFDQLLREARPAFSRTGGAVGLLSIDKGPPMLTLALDRNAKAFAIRHELYHVAREARSVTERGVSLFELEKSAGLLTKIGLMLKEESIVWWKTLR